MKESMKNYLKMGLIHFMAYPAVVKDESQVEETLQKILVDDYFEIVEMTHIQDASVRAKVRDMLKVSAVTATYGAQPHLLGSGLNINDVDPQKRAEAVAFLKKDIDEAYEQGLKGFAFLSGRYEEATKNQSFAALVDSTVQLCQYSASKGDMPVALEVFDYDVDKKSLIGPAGYAKEFAQEVRKSCSNFGLMMDLSHFPLTRETSREALTTVKDYIVHAHVGNAVTIPGKDAYGDAHPRFGFPSSANGVEELRDFLKVLIDIGYLSTENPRIVSFEVKPFGTENCDLVVANAKRTMNRAWAML